MDTSLLEQRNRALRQRCSPLPGSVPHTNTRPINVPGRFHGQRLIDCLCELLPQVGRRQWQSWFNAGHIVRGDHPVDAGHVVQGGGQYQHVFPNTTEPEVNAAIDVLWEDDQLIVVNKPAPLPLHPSGRFRLNTLTSLLSMVYPSSDLRVVHRLDANTSGVVVLARSKRVASDLSGQFGSRAVAKDYVAICRGQPSRDVFSCSQPISRQRGPGGSRKLCQAGDEAHTEFRVLDRLENGTSFLLIRPRTGRTHQIRVHLWSLNHPIVGDPMYLAEQQIHASATVPVRSPPMCLHAWRLECRHPQSHQSVEFRAPIPDWPHRTSSLTDPAAVLARRKPLT